MQPPVAPPAPPGWLLATLGAVGVLCVVLLGSLLYLLTPPSVVSEGAPGVTAPTPAIDVAAQKSEEQGARLSELTKTNAAQRTQLEEMTAKLAALEKTQASAPKPVENGTFKLCNETASPVSIKWLAVTYRDAPDSFKTFNSAFVPQKVWSVPARQDMELQYRNGDRRDWDGSVVFYALELEHQNQMYNVAGAWSALSGDCFRFKPGG